jgi:hypothetical protein
MFYGRVTRLGKFLPFGRILAIWANFAILGELCYFGLDFQQFSSKKIALFSKTNATIEFLQNLALFEVKNAIFSPIFFGENMF